MKPFALFSCWPALVASTLALAGCFGAPERCDNCSAFFDAGPPDEDSPDVPIATGGSTGSGGVIGSGGASSGGMTGSGGSNTGGANTGGANTGGVGGGATGGRGGANTGGANTGGANTGGANTGGAATGGRGTGGTAGGMGGASTGGAGGTPVDPDLVLWYKFDNNATDSAKYGGTARDGTATSVTYSTNTHQVGTHSLNLSGTSSYVSVPNLQTQLPGGVTISCWVNVRMNQNWQRVFDFGTMATTPMIYMFLTTNQAATSPNSVRFAIGTMGNGQEDVINMTTPGNLTTGVWHHLAVVLPAGPTYTGTLYIDGMVAGTNANMTIHPSAIGMPNSFIGRSQWPNDPYFNGYVDDFRVYRRALTAAEITALRAVTQ